MKSRLIILGLFTCSTVALAGCKDISNIVSSLNKPEQTTAVVTSSVTSVELVTDEPVVVFSGEPSLISLSKNYLPSSYAGEQEATNEVSEEVHPSQDQDYSGYFEMTWDFDGYFSIRERYEYSSLEFQKCRTYVIPGELDSLTEIIGFTADFFEEEQFSPKTANGYEYMGKESLLFPDIGKLSQKRAYALAQAEKEHVDRLAEEEALVAPVTKPFILSTSEDTLKMSKYTMRVQVGETKQICIAQCPKGYEDKLIFMTDNKSSAIVDENGNVTGVKSGSATITVTVDGAAGYSSVMIYVY